MELTSIIYTVLTGLFFVGILCAILVIVDHKARLDGEARKDIWSIQGRRDNHPIWAWMVGGVLLSICGMILVGMVSRLGFEEGGPQYAIKVASIFGGEEEMGGGGAEKSKLLQEIKRGEIFQIRKHFHHTLEEDPTEKGKQTVCFYCHGNYPHKRQRMIRTLLNMHTQFIGCMTCHLEGVPEEKMILRWYNFSGIEPKGRPFGLAYDPKTGALERTDDYYSKITVFVEMDGEEKLMEIPEDTPLAREFIKIRSRLTPEEENKIKNMFHKNVGPKGRFCTKCHRTENSMIPFRKLGFSNRRIEDLTGLNIVSITQKYKEFFIPTIYRDVTAPKKREELMGPEEEPVKIPASKLYDPRFWWHERYRSPFKKEKEKEKEKE